MHAYRDQYAQLFHDGRNVVLIGISTDPVDALASWAKDDEFPFLFASDSEQERYRKSTRLNSSHITISYAVFCLKKKKPSRFTFRLHVTIAQPVPIILLSAV